MPYRELRFGVAFVSGLLIQVPHALLEQRQPLGKHLGLVGQPGHRRGEVQEQQEHEAETRR